MAPRITDPEQLKELLRIPFTPEQLACITAPLAPQVIVAGAGSGKTTVMAARVVWLVGTGQVAPEQVLGLTFTNKAAGELAERVRRALVEAGVTDPDPDPADPDQAPGEPRISTYHAFAGQLLKDHGLRVGLEPSARLLADATRYQLAARVLRTAPGPYPALTRPFADLVTDLLALDGELSEHLVPVERLRAYDTELLRTLEGVKLSNEALRKVPETARARLELLGLVEAYRAEKRARDLLDFGDQIALSATLACTRPEVGRMLREEFAVVLLDEYQDTSVAQRLLLSGLFGNAAPLDGDPGRDTGAPPGRNPAAHSGDGPGHDPGAGPDHTPEDGHGRAGARAGAGPGGAEDSASAGPGASAGAGASARPGAGAGHPVTAVGDPCQAIYGWRGASVANLDDFPEHFPQFGGPAGDRAEEGAPGARALRPARRFALSENRRSGGRLLTLANTLAAPLRARHEGVEALRPAPGAEHDGRVRCALLRTHAEELAWIADSIAHLVRTGTPPGQIAVLCRTATDFARIQGALVEREVPVEVVGLSGLLHLPEVADLVAVCEVLQDPTANAALVRLLTGPRWRIGPRDLALLGRRARLLVGHGDRAGTDPDRRLAEAVEGVDPAEAISLADALDTFLGVPDAGTGATGTTGGGPGQYGAVADDGLPFSPEARVRFARLAAELRDLRRGLADPLMDVLHRVLAVTGLEVELSASPQALAARRRETLQNFLDVAARFASLDGEATLLAFLGFLRTAAQYEKGLDNALPGGENTVKVLTAHKSKGLEWDVVAVPGLVAKQFPSEQARESWTSNAKVLPHALRGDAATLPDVSAWDSKGMSAFQQAMKEHQHTEELRLGYVTFTRPRSLLLASGHWWGPTQKKPRGPSQFLEALREHCALGEGHGEVEVWAEPPAEGEENPALDPAEADRAWPLPLDPDALARRRRAADLVLAHLAAPDPAAPAAAAPAPGRAPAGPEPDPAAGPGPDPAAAGRPHGRPPQQGAREWPESHGHRDGAGRPDDPAYDLPDDPAYAPEDPAYDLPDGAYDPEDGAYAPGDGGTDPEYAPEDPGYAPVDPGHGLPDDGYGPDIDASGPPDEEDGDLADWEAWSPVRPGAAPGGSTPAGPVTPGRATGEHPAGEPETGGPDSATPAHAGTAPTGRLTTAGAAGRAASVGHPVSDERPVTAAATAPHGVAGAADGSGAASPGEDRTAPGPDVPGPRHPGDDPPADGVAETGLTPEEARLAASWDRDLDALAGELRRARASVREVPLPAVLSASQLLRLAEDPDGFARELARPMPRPPRPAARRGTRFHAWVESRFEALPLPMLGPDELPGHADDDLEIADERELDELKEAFSRTEYARRTPYRVEAPVQVVLAGRTVRGRIDAVYRETGPDGDRYEIIDWKTGRTQDADPLQLAIYRVAWAEQYRVPLSAVTAAFLYVRDGEVVRPPDLPGRAELERLLAGEEGPAL
ncbi:UvrD-helicase domain-containing protein [Streptomyces pactum]|uniref:UvrD-helicase domain-containing protein n=1 Tax=Streptomyces pactum TaxID=68249 RepID=UPI0036FD42AE